MRHILFLFTLLTCAAPHLFAQSWRWQNPRPQGNALISICFVDVNHGWAVGDGGAVLATTDGGVTWAVQFSDTVRNLLHVTFVDTLHGWAAGDFGVRHTSDGGRHWEPQLTADYPLTLDLAFADANNGILLGSGHNYRTTDGGANWTPTELPGGEFKVSVQFLDDQHGWVLSSASYLARTTDGGQTWEQDTIPSPDLLLGVNFSDPLHGWINTRTASFRPGFLRTTDGGASWTTLPDPGLIGDYYTFVFRGPDLGYGLSPSQQQFVRTTNGGVTWTSLPTGALESAMNGFAVVSDFNLWLVGSLGLLRHSIDGGETWIAHDHNVTTATLAGVAFANAGVGVTVGNADDGATVLRTTTGGAAWTVVDSLRDETLNCVALRPSGQGWTAGVGGLLRRTTDFGQTWEPQSIPAAGDLYDLCFTDDQHGWAVGGRNTPDGLSGAIFHTATGGESWQLQREDPATIYRQLFREGPDRIWAVGDSGAVVRSTDGGETWESRSLPAPWSCRRLISVGFADSLHGWVTGSGPCEGSPGTYAGFATTDGGLTWNPTPLWFNRMNFTDALHGWIVGLGYVRHTADGGATWVRDTLDINRWALTSATFLDADHGWAVGWGGAILALGSTASSVPEAPAATPPRALSLTAGPNPFNATTRLSFTLPQAGPATLKIYDITGRLVTTLLDEHLAAGPHTRTFDGKHLASGLYFARLESAHRTATYKLVLLK